MFVGGMLGTKVLLMCFTSVVGVYGCQYPSCVGTLPQPIPLLLPKLPLTVFVPMCASSSPSQWSVQHSWCCHSCLVCRSGCFVIVLSLTNALPPLLLRQILCRRCRLSPPPPSCHYLRALWPPIADVLLCSVLWMLCCRVAQADTSPP